MGQRKINELLPNKNYAFKIRAKVGGDFGPWSPPIVHQTLNFPVPDPPVISEVIEALRQITVRWEPVDPSQNIFYYELHISTEVDFTPSVDTTLFGQTSNNFAVFDRIFDGVSWLALEPATEYQIKIIAVSRGLTKSSASLVTATTTSSFDGDTEPPDRPINAPSIIRTIGTNIIDMSDYEIPSDYSHFIVEAAQTGDEEIKDRNTPPEIFTDFVEISGPADSKFVHAGLDYNTWYTYRYKVVDLSGNVSLTSDASEPVVPRFANEDGVIDIQAGSISSDLINSEIILSGFIATATDGKRVVLDNNGIRVYDRDNQPIINMPTEVVEDGEGADVNQPFFKARVNADSLTVQGPATMRDTLGMDVNSDIVLASSITNPSSEATIIKTWDTIEYDDPIFGGVGSFAVSSNTKRGMQYTFDTNIEEDVFLVGDFENKRLYEFRMSDGLIVKQIVIARSPMGITINYDNLLVYVLVKNNGRFYIEQKTVPWDAISGFDAIRQDEVTNQLLGAQIGGIAFSEDDDKVWIVEKNNSNVVRLNSWVMASSGTTPTSYTKLLTALELSNNERVVDVEVDDTFAYVLIANESLSKSYVKAVDKTTGVYDPTLDFSVPWEAKGLTRQVDIPNSFAFVRFWSSLDTSAVKHTNWVLGSSDTYWLKYAWRDLDTGNETLPSPAAIFTVPTRQKITVTTPPLPSIPGGNAQLRVYIANGDLPSEPANSAFYRQLDDTSGGDSDMSTFNISNLQTSGTNPVTVSGFTTSLGTPALISGDHNMRIRGDGAIIPYKDTNANAPSAPIEGQFFYNTTHKTMYYRGNSSEWIPTTAITALPYSRRDLSTNLNDANLFNPIASLANNDNSSTNGSHMLTRALQVSMPFSGSFVGLSFVSSADKTGGTASFRIQKNGSAVSGTELTWANSTSSGYVPFDPGTYTFAAGDTFRGLVTTDNSFAPADSLDVLIQIWVMRHD